MLISSPHPNSRYDAEVDQSCIWILSGKTLPSRYLSPYRLDCAIYRLQASEMASAAPTEE
jgi:hypothetical protein